MATTMSQLHHGFTARSVKALLLLAGCGILLAASLTTGAAAAQPGHAAPQAYLAQETGHDGWHVPPAARAERPVLDRRIALQLENATVEEALAQIMEHGDVQLAYLKETVAVGKQVTLHRQAVTVREALQLVLQDTGLVLVPSGGQLIITRPSPKAQVMAAGHRLMQPIRLRGAGLVQGRWTPPTGTIRGTVLDADGVSVPGANVVIVGTTQGASTDLDGHYVIENVEPGTHALRASFVGYLSQTREGVEVRAGETTDVDFVLEQGGIDLDELVVVGYGTQKRSNLTGAISSVDVGQMENKPQLRLDQALQGMAAGVTVTQSGGAPGAAPSIHIRGVGSISGTEPLWIVDGIKMESGANVNINDVESIEVLKDAAAAAIYGAQAAHGVILVTTKRGRGETSVSFSSSVGRRAPLNLPTLLGSADFVAYKKASRLNAGQNPEPAWDQWEHDTNWIEEYYAGSGMLTSNTLAISRGEGPFNFYISLGYDDEAGILIDNSYEKLRGRINSDLRLTDWLKVGESLMLTRINENPIDNNNENTTGAIPYRSIPIMPVYEADNPYGGWGRGPAYFQGPNPVATQYQQHVTNTNTRIDGSAYAELTPLEGLVLKGTVGYNAQAFLGEQFHEAFDYGAFSNTINALTYFSADHRTLSGTATATYNTSVGNHHVQVMGGYEALQYDLEQFNLTGTDFPVDVAWSMNLARGALNTTERFNVYKRRILSQFGRVNYNYDDRYLFEANVRRDASAPKFGPENIWGIFPSFSAGWNISNEKFFDVPYISNLRLRASSGQLGSDNIGDYIYLKTYTSQFSSYAFDANGQNKVPGFFISKFPNEEVKWEEVNMHNVGLDVGAFNNRLTFGADFYLKDTRDLLYGIPIPPSVGIAVHNFSPVNPQVNIGTLRNMGVDLQLGYKTEYKDFFFDVSANTSFLKNEMKSLHEGGYIIGGYGGGQISGMARTQPGLPISSFYGYVVQQVLNSRQDVYAVNSWAPDGTYQESGTGPGDLMYVDISGPEGVPDGQITAAYDRVYLGNPWPKMTYGLNFNMTYKAFDVALQLQGVQGVDVFNADKAYTRNFFGDNNTTPLIAEAWTPEHHTDHPRNIASDPNGNFSKPSSYFVEDGSYLKLRNVQIGYTVPERLLARWGVDGLRVYLNGNNLLTLTPYSGLDPEIAGANTSRGIDYGLYPQVRTISGGVELQF